MSDLNRSRIALVLLAAVVLGGGPAVAAETPSIQAPPAPWSERWIGPFDPVLVDGKAWTFHTPPPPRNERKVADAHPRILLTRQSLPEFREKLKHPAYDARVKELVREAQKSDACANAVLYQAGVGERESYGRKAKELVLAGKYTPIQGLESGGAQLAAVLAYDWTAELLTPAERKAAFKKIVAMFDFNSKWTHQGWYGNDPYARMQGFIYQALCIFAGYGDGCDDAWCAAMRDRFYEEDPDHIGMYGPERGQGLLDVLNSIGLDTGGSQAGNHGDNPTTGYTGMYLTGSPLLLAGWQTATGEPVLRQCNWLRYLPRWLAYESNRWVYTAPDGAGQYASVPTGRGAAALEYLTGLYQQIDPDMAALAAWWLQKVGPDRYVLIPRIVLGDLRVEPKSPEQIGLPTAAYLRGADGFFSMSSWADDASRVHMLIRYLDTNRYEPHTNVFTITKYGYLACGSRPGKGRAWEGNHSGLWVYDPELDCTDSHKIQGTTYWASTLRYPKRRATGAREAAEDMMYRAGGPTAVGIHDGYRFATADAARLLSAEGAKRYERTILHLLPLGPDREYVVVHDRTEAEGNVRRVWGLRPAAVPVTDVEQQRQGEGYLTFPTARRVTVVNRHGNNHGVLHMSIVLPEHCSVEFWGDRRHEGFTPDGKPYLVDKSAREERFAEKSFHEYRYGVGNLFVTATPTRTKQNYLMVMQIGDAATLTVERAARVVRVPDPANDAVQVDEWLLLLATEPARREQVAYTLVGDARRHAIFDLEPGRYRVAKNGALLPDTFEVRGADFSLGFSAVGKAGDKFTVARQR